jgi:hypothetical protein
MMSVSPVYPVSRHEPAGIVDLGDRSERERLSPSAISAFFNIMAAWRVRDEDARALLGGVSNGPFYELKKKPRTLDADTLTRVSFLIGIFKALNILYPGDLADAWVTRANSGRMFRGTTPLAFMIRGGLPAMQAMRQLLDARRGAQ